MRHGLRGFESFPLPTQNLQFLRGLLGLIAGAGSLRPRGWNYWEEILRNRYPKPGKTTPDGPR